MPIITIRALPKERPRAAMAGIHPHVYNKAEYNAYLSDCATLLRNLRLPVFTQPCALTLHFAQAVRIAHVAASAKRKAYSRRIQPSGDADNLAGGFMDAANTILYTDDVLVHELHVTLDRHAAADAIHFDCTAL
jgi:Holliday junction resolvase RusA-like endonuclease